ncbi:MAG: hypothetical protein AAFW69_05460 [Pseudomonadota bacterium]
MRALIPLLFLAAPALAEETIRILPDQAILACHARTEQAVEAIGGSDPRTVERYTADRMDGFMFSVHGLLEAEIEGERRELDVACDVSSAGVEVFTMVVEDMMTVEETMAPAE